MPRQGDQERESVKTAQTMLKGLVHGNSGRTWLQVSLLLAQRIQSFHSAPFGSTWALDCVAMAKKKKERKSRGQRERKAWKNKWHQKGTDGETSGGQESGMT